MKSWKRAVTVALCAASLLVGCGVQSGNVSNDDSTDEPQQITVEQLRAANDQRSLLEKHGAVTVTVQESDQNDAVIDTAKFQYTYVVWMRCWPGIIASTPKTATQRQSRSYGVEANGAMDAARMESDSDRGSASLSISP